MTGHRRVHGDGASGGNGEGEPAGHHKAGTPHMHGAGTVAEAEASVGAALQAGQVNPAGEGPGGHDSADGADAVTQVPHPDDAQLAGFMDRYDKLGEQPPTFDLAANDAVHSGDGAHTSQRHGPDVPLPRDPNPSSGNRTVEGRIHGDAPWGQTENWSYKWTDTAAMNRTVNEYVRENWETIRSDLAIRGKHDGSIVADHPVGQGYYNTGMYGAGPRESKFAVTALAKIRIRTVEGSDPPVPFVLTCFPAGIL